CESCPVAKTFADGQSHRSEMVVSSKSGEKYNVLIHTAPIRNAAGAIEQVMEMSTNITEIRVLQDHLSSLGLMVGSVSHGIKGILTGLDAGLYLLNSGLTKEDQGQIEEGLEVLNLMVERIRGVVLDILYYAKERPLDCKPVDVLQFAQDVTALIEPKIRKHPIAFIPEFNPPLGVFEADARVVFTALTNIIENAIEACLEDPAPKDHHIVFGATRTRDHVVFDVRDNGIGMDQESQDNLFNLFYSSKGLKGTGFGLFIANKIIRQHGGAIEVDSSPGQGTHFRILMPKQGPPAVPDAPAARAGETG
ncbi:MAG: HAMP domain-containing histidine kinase, partial [Desulfobacterales bacterium]